jgi:predicted nuclease of predicted toxin-antitoxin system
VRLLLDELFPPEIARALRTQGHEVRAIQEEPAQRGLADAEVLAMAIREGRALLTENVRDFRPLAAALLKRGEGHSGLVLTSNRRYPRWSADTLGRLVRDLGALIRAHPEQPKDMELWL